MFKRIKRYLVFLCVFAFATSNITDIDLFLEEGSSSISSVETVEAAIDQGDTEPDGEAVKTQDDKEHYAEPVKSQDDTEPAEKAVKNQDGIKADLEEALSLDDKQYDLQPKVEENSWDTSLEHVSNYIHRYQKLPPVYITKKEAYVLGGELSDIMTTRSIGGDYFGNYQGLLPRKKGRSYKECDIDTLGAESRGKKRIVYSNDGLMYYTDDHYATFTLLYSDWDNTNLQIL